MNLLGKDTDALDEKWTGQWEASTPIRLEEYSADKGSKHARRRGINYCYIFICNIKDIYYVIFEASLNMCKKNLDVYTGRAFVFLGARVVHIIKCFFFYIFILFVCQNTIIYIIN